MGCGASRIDKEERVRRCKERKRLMKQLVGYRSEFAASLMAYLRAVKNTGGTLRQFTEAETLQLDSTPFGLVVPPSPLPPLPPSPPPPFSPYVERSRDNNKNEEPPQEKFIETDEGYNCTPPPPPPPPPPPSSSWDSWDPFGPSASYHFEKNSESVEQVEEENWAETNTEFEEEEEENDVVTDIVQSPLPEKPAAVELTDDNSSMVSCYTKDTAEMTMVVWENKKTLAGIVGELDDYFLKASSGGKEITVLLDINSGDAFHQNICRNKRKRCKSGKVFSALSWSWSSKSLQSSRDIVEFQGRSEPCRPGAHCITLDKLYAEEKKLYLEVKDEEITKLEYVRKALLLQKLEAEDQDWVKTDKVRLNVESLQSDIMCLQQSIDRSCSSILKFRDEELHPQLVYLSSGLMHMWRTMYECHQVQNHISQQMSHLINHPSMEPTTENHRQATAQLETEVTAWYNSFCSLLRSQRDYVQTLHRWVQLTNCLVDDQPPNLSGVHALCEEWHLALERLPHKVAAESIKSFVSVIHSIVLQQNDERCLQKKSDRLEKRLKKEMNSLEEMEKKLEDTADGSGLSSLSPKHPISIKRAKTEAFRKHVESEKAKYLNSVQLSRAMTLNNLQTSLPNVFQALTGFSSVCAQTFEAVQSCQ